MYVCLTQYKREVAASEIQDSMRRKFRRARTKLFAIRAFTDQLQACD